MKTVIAIATYRRESYLEKTLESLKGQADEILVYDNAKEKVDYKANAKFIFLKDFSEPVYYFSCDDDIIYPKDYVEKTLNYIKRYQGIITYHGDVLTKTIPGSYPESKRFHFRSDLYRAIRVDVAGTGLTAFRTDYFNPDEIYKSKYKNMVDQLFSLEASQQNKKIIIPPHSKDLFASQPVPPNRTIWGKYANKRPEQIELANEILRIKKW